MENEVFNINIIKNKLYLLTEVNSTLYNSILIITSLLWYELIMV